MKKNATCWLFPSGKWWKILLIMKLKIFFLLVSLGTLQAAGYSQDSRFNLKKNDVLLTEVLQELQQQSEYRFFYQKDIFQQADRVNVDMKNVSLRQILDEVLIRHGFSYEMIDKVITIRKIQQQKTAGRKITGIVMDTRKQSLPGVTVLLKGTALGVVTDKEGRFNIEIPETDPIVLVFSFVGMKKQEVTYTGQEDIQVVMEEEVTEMDEVVITGYQGIDRKKLTSAITSVKAEDIMIPGVNSIDQMLEGRIPDLMLTTNSGEVGVVPRLRIRGTSTLVGNREPLWVVNGVVVNDPVPLDSDVLNDPDYVNRIGNAIAGLNPQDIQRIDVLKDAAATTLYGTRAANGVIVITTKKGHVGKPVVRYNMTTTYKRRPRYSDRKIDLMNSKERIDLSRELAAASYLYPSDMSIVGYEYLLQQLYAGVIDDEQFAIEVKKLENNNTDWFDILTEDAFSHNHTLSISGGSDQLRYYSSVGYTKDNDVIKGQGISRYTGNLSLESDLTKWLKASMDFNANISERNYEQSAVGSVNYAYTTSRAIAAYEEGGDLSYYQKRYNSFYRYDFNILNERANSYTKQENSGFDLTSRLIFRFVIIKSCFRNDLYDRQTLSTKHAGRKLSSFDTLLHNDFIFIAKCSLKRSLIFLSTLYHTDTNAGTTTTWFHNDRICHIFRQIATLSFANGKSFRRWDPCLQKDLFGQSFIHGNRTAYAAGTCVTNAKQIERCLYFTIFTICAMQRHIYNVCLSAKCQNIRSKETILGISTHLLDLIQIRVNGLDLFIVRADRIISYKKIL